MARTDRLDRRVLAHPDDEVPPHSPGLVLSERLPWPWLFPLLVFAVTWPLIVASWYVSDAIYHESHPWTWHFLFKDAKYYLAIAQHGYSPTISPHWHDNTEIVRRDAFFPLFPMLIRLTSYLTGGHYLAAAVLVCVAAGGASALGVWALASRVRDRWTADRAVVLYCVFPGAMTFGMLYSEPLAVAIAAAGLLALLNRRWLLAGLLGAVGTAERPTLGVLAVVYGIVAIAAIRDRRDWRALLAPALTPLGIVAFFGYFGHRYHDYAFWFRVERKGWDQHIDFGLHTLRIVFWSDPGTSKYPLYNVVLIIMFIAAVAGVAMMLAARLPRPLSLYAVAVLLLSIASTAQSTKPRFVWTAFPLFIGAAAKLPRAAYWPVVVLSAAGLVFLTGWWPNHYAGPAP